MAILDFQHLLLKLYTNKKAFNEFRQDPEKILKSSNLNARELDAIKKIPIDLIEKFGHSLTHKRSRAAHKLLRIYPRKIVASSFHMSNPVIFFNSAGEIKSLDITEGDFNILRLISGPVFSKNLFDAYIKSSENAVSFFNISLILTKKNFWGKSIVIL
jgi:hypothetical protein